MNKAFVILGVCVAASILISGIPNAVESSVTVSHTLSPTSRSVVDKITASGTLSYSEESDITSSIPLVIDKFLVKAGDSVGVGDVIAYVDRQSSAALIESMARINSLAVSAENVSAAVSLLPDKITSDCSGKIISTSGNGQAVQSGCSIARAAQTDDIIVTASVSETDISQVSIGDPAEITLAAYPDTTFAGHVTNIAQTAHSRYNGAVLETVVDVEITPDTPDERLKSGLTADVDIMLSEAREALVLPYSAIGQDDSGEYVRVYENGKAVRRDIVTGKEFADCAEITSGISIDDVILAKPDELSDKHYIRVESGE